MTDFLRFGDAEAAALPSGSAKVVAAALRKALRVGAVDAATNRPIVGFRYLTLAKTKKGEPRGDQVAATVGDWPPAWKRAVTVPHGRVEIGYADEVVHAPKVLPKTPSRQRRTKKAPPAA